LRLRKPPRDGCDGVRQYGKREAFVRIEGYRQEGGMVRRIEQRNQTTMRRRRNRRGRRRRRRRKRREKEGNTALRVIRTDPVGTPVMR